MAGAQGGTEEPLPALETTTPLGRYFAEAFIGVEKNYRKKAQFHEKGDLCLSRPTVSPTMILTCARASSEKQTIGQQLETQDQKTRVNGRSD